MAKRICKRLQSFLQSHGIHSFEDQFNPNGTLPDFILQAGGYKKLRHSLGLIATSLLTRDKDFINELWNAELEPYAVDYFDPYYDALLYFFSFMHLSGNYRVITPACIEFCNIRQGFLYRFVSSQTEMTGHRNVWLIRILPIQNNDKQICG